MSVDQLTASEPATFTSSIDTPIEVQIDGMHCNACASGLEQHLRSVGIADASVDFASSSVRFSSQWDHALPKVTAAIEQLGYHIVGSKRHSLAPSIEALVLFCAVFSAPLMLHMVVDWHPLHNQWVQLCLTLPVVALGIWYFGSSALRSLRAGTANMDLLIITGVVASFVYSLVGTLLDLGAAYSFYETSASIVTTVLLGNLLEKRAVKKTSSALEELGRLQPTHAQRYLTGSIGGTEKIDASKVLPGDTLLVNMGDRIAADSILTWGAGTVDESMISGESLPVDKQVGAHVIGGTLLLSGTIKIKVERVGENSTLASIVRMVKDAQRRKPSIQRIGDRVSAIFVPVVIAIALFTFIFSWSILGVGFQNALLRMIAVLVVACPCAMGLATPTAVMMGLGKAARAGLLIKGGDTLEKLASVKALAFDKTGTLTSGRFIVEDEIILRGTREHLAGVILSLETHSSHPIARSLCRYFQAYKPVALIDLSEMRGVGMQGKTEAGITYRLGSLALLKHMGRDLPSELVGYDLFLLEDDLIVAAFQLGDELRPQTAQTISELLRAGYRLSLISGDNTARCQALGQKIGITQIFAESLPADKLQIIEDLERQTPTAFIGDGINDAPTLARASVGVSLGDASSAAINAAQVVLLKDSIAQLPEALRIAKLTLLTIKQNLFWAFFYNTLMIPLAALGYLSPMIAAFSMIFSDLIVVANSLRLRRR